MNMPSASFFSRSSNLVLGFKKKLFTGYCSSDTIHQKSGLTKEVSKLDVEFFEYKVEAKASMDALEKKIDDAAKTTLYVPSIRQAYEDIGLELHNSNAESITTTGKNLRPKYWDVEGSNKLDPGTTNDINGERLKPRTCVLFVEGLQPTCFGQEFGVDPQAAIDREMQHMGEQIFGARLELIVVFDSRAFEGLNYHLGKGEERITWNPWIKHHPP
ncbi:hypothetical protein Tco_0355963 [Tanacetum coccineum]